MLGFSRILVLASIAMVLPSAATASALVDSVSGTVEIGGATAIPGQRIFPGRIVTTGANSQATLTFDDKMQLVIGADTELRIVDFRYAQGHASDRAVFDLTRGSLRVVTGAVARRGETAFSLRTPQASFAVRAGPADFTVALVNPAYLNVGAGQVVVSNSAGSAVFGPGATAQVANSAALAAAVAPAQLPPLASSALQGLTTASVNAAGGVAYGVTAGAPGTGGVSFAMGGTVAAAAAALAAAASSRKGSTAQHAPPAH